MSDNAESPTESQKEEPQPPSEDSTTNDQKKKSKFRIYIYVTTIGFVIEGKERAGKEFMPVLCSLTFLQLTLILANRIVRVHCSANHHLTFIT